MVVLFQAEGKGERLATVLIKGIYIYIYIYTHTHMYNCQIAIQNFSTGQFGDLYPPGAIY